MHVIGSVFDEEAKMNCFVRRTKKRSASKTERPAKIEATEEEFLRTTYVASGRSYVRS